MSEGLRKALLAAAVTLPFHASSPTLSHQLSSQGCFTTLKWPNEFNARQRFEVKRAIKKALPLLRSGDKRVVEITLKSLGKLARTASFIPGNEFFEEWKGFPGVRVVTLKNLRTNNTSVSLKSLYKLDQSPSAPPGTEDGDKVLIHDSNGSLVKFEGRTYLLTNKHVLGIEMPGYVEDLRIGKYVLDAALIELDPNTVPSEVSPVPLVAHGDEGVIGEPFLIPGINPDQDTPDLRSVVVTTGFTLPISNNMIEFRKGEARTSEGIIAQGGVHEDCTKDKEMRLGGISGSGVYNRSFELIGVFYGGFNVSQNAASIKLVTFVPTHAIIEGIRSGKVPILPTNGATWVKE